MNCKHENIGFVEYDLTYMCKNMECQKDFEFDEIIVITQADYDKMNAVVEYFAQLLCDNPDLVGELCVCEGYEAGLDNLGQACPICDDRSPLWIRGQEIKALEVDMSKKICEICNTNEANMDFNYAAPMGASFQPEVSDNPQMFKAMVCLDCFGKEIDDTHVVLAVVTARRLEDAKEGK